MTNQEKLEKYLVGETGYLKNDLSNGKVIMLSGKWGSGKTHFWQNIIATKELKEKLKDKEQSYSYISLYGKTSIEEIENDIFGQVYIDAIGGENFITKGFSTFTKRLKRFGSKKIADGLDNEQKDNMERIALKRLYNGGIICFDDFERKSKDIDLNDLFGFITQLSLNFNCKVVIILNDDVFEAEEKTIFSNVKEKTVSKFLYYNPTIDELFNLIFERNNEYKKLNEYKGKILETIKETKELNARIYIQILDNLSEWLKENCEHNDEIIRCIILVNIKFIIFHKTSSRVVHEASKLHLYQSKSFYNKGHNYNKNRENGFNGYKEFTNFDKYFTFVISRYSGGKNTTQESKTEIISFLKENKKEFEFEFLINILNIARNVNDNVFDNINYFIETGILKDE